MEINFNNNDWDVITFTLNQFRTLSKDFIKSNIEKHLKNTNLNNKKINIIDTKQSSIIDSSGESKHFIAIYFEILDK